MRFLSGNVWLRFLSQQLTVELGFVRLIVEGHTVRLARLEAFVLRALELCDRPRPLCCGKQHRQKKDGKKTRALCTCTSPTERAEDVYAFSLAQTPKERDKRKQKKNEREERSWLAWFRSLEVSRGAGRLGSHWRRERSEEDQQTQRG